MEPSFHNMQIVVLDVRGKSFSVGDVVAFRCDGLSSVVVKRIAAVSGDCVQIKNHELIVNDEASNIYSGTVFEYEGIVKDETLVPDNCYFVLGDNIGESIDSRYPQVGLVDGSSIIGKVVLFRKE